MSNFIYFSHGNIMGEWTLPLESARGHPAGQLARRADVTLESSLLGGSASNSSQDSSDNMILDAHLHIADTEDMESLCDIEEESEDGLETNLRKDAQRIRDALQSLSLDFDTRAWVKQMSDRIKSLEKKLKPCSYEHFMLLLLETSETTIMIQKCIQKFLREKHPREFSRLDERSRSEVHESSDRELLGSEFQMLRRLLAPIRPTARRDARNIIKWIDRKDEDTDRTLRDLRRSGEIIQQFRSEVKYQIPEEHDRLSLNSPGGVTRERSVNLRLARLDSCEEVFAKGVSTLVMTADQSSTPPENTPTPAQIPLDTAEVMVMTARWLARARGPMAVDLFCDVAKLFSTRPPKASTDQEFSYVFLLSSIHPPEPDVKYSGDSWIGHSSGMKNSTYFRDCEASQQSMMKTIRKGPRKLREADGLPSSAELHGHRLTSHGGLIDGYYGMAARPYSNRGSTSFGHPTTPTDPM